MSMIGCFRRLSRTELEELIASPETIFEHLDGVGDSSAMDVDKAWHGIHFLLTGNAWEVEDALGSAVIGGVEIGEDVGYGPARYLTPERVQEVAAALEGLTPEQFVERFDAGALEKNQIYPEIWGEGEGALEYLEEYYKELRSYYLAAAAQGEAMLLYLQ